MGQQLLDCMLGHWGLMRELQQLRNLFLLASPASQAWAGRLLGALIKGREMEELKEFELEGALQVGGRGGGGQGERVLRAGGHVCV